MKLIPTATRAALLTASFAMLAACGGEVTEAEGPEASGPADELTAAIGERQENFEALGDAFKAIRGQFESEAPDMAVIAEAAAAMSNKAQAIDGLFPAGTSLDDGYETEALATIWEKPEEFEAARQKLVTATGEFATIAAAGELDAVKAQAGAVGKSCKGCHDEFRLDKD